MTDAITIVSDDTPREAIKLTDFSTIEPLVNEYARSLAIKNRINPDHFVVHLVSNLKGIMIIQAGEHVQIYLLWPHAQPNINTLLKSAFRAMHNHSLKRSMAIVPIALIKSFDEENRKMYRQKFGEVGDILPDLIPRQRLKMQVTTTVTLTDTKTGEQVTTTHADKPVRYDGNLVGMWLRLSRIVRELHHEAILEDDVEDASATPELDAARL